jgi:hypothetical protein
MRITREYIFDLIELVGKAVVTARKKAAGPEWDLDEQVARFIDRWRLNRDRIEKAVQEEAAAENNHWGLDLGGWKDSTENGTAGSLDDRPRETYSRWGSEAFEQRRAQREYDFFGDAAACSLWEIQRRLRFKETGVMDSLKDLQGMCDNLRTYISTGWANRLAAIIDQSSG